MCTRVDNHRKQTEVRGPSAVLSESDCIMLRASNALGSCFGLLQEALFWEPSAAPGSVARLIDVGRRGGLGW